MKCWIVMHAFSFAFFLNNDTPCFSCPRFGHEAVCSSLPCLWKLLYFYRLYFLNLCFQKRLSVESTCFLISSISTGFEPSGASLHWHQSVFFVIHQSEAVIPHRFFNFSRCFSSCFSRSVADFSRRLF